MEVLLNGFYLNVHTIGFDLQSQKLERRYETATITLGCFIIAANSSKRSLLRSLAPVNSFFILPLFLFSFKSRLQFKMRSYDSWPRSSKVIGA